MTNEERDILNGAQRKLPDDAHPRDEYCDLSAHDGALFVVGRESSVRALEEALTPATAASSSPRSMTPLSMNPPPKTSTPSVSSATSSSPCACRTAISRCLVEGVERARSSEVNDEDGFFVATVRTSRAAARAHAHRPSSSSPACISCSSSTTSVQQSLNQENANSLRTDEPAKLADVIAANLQLSIEEKQQLLEVFDPRSPPFPHRRYARHRYPRKAQHGPAPSSRA